MPSKYPQPFKDRATRMVFDRLDDEDAPNRYTVIRETAPKLRIAAETLRRWVEQAEVDAGNQPGVRMQSQEEIRKLKRENASTAACQWDPQDRFLGFHWSSQHLAQAELAASVGTYDNTFAETVNGLYKTELIYARLVWPSATEVEFQTMN